MILAYPDEASAYCYVHLSNRLRFARSCVVIGRSASDVLIRTIRIGSRIVERRFRWMLSDNDRLGAIEFFFAKLAAIPHSPQLR